MHATRSVETAGAVGVGLGLVGAHDAVHVECQLARRTAHASLRLGRPVEPQPDLEPVAFLECAGRPGGIDRAREPVRRGDVRLLVGLGVAADGGARSTRPAMRSGASRAASSATPPPIELPTNQPGASGDTASSTASTSSTCRKGPSAGGTSPNPRRSYATTSLPAAASRAPTSRQRAGRTRPREAGRSLSRRRSRITDERCAPGSDFHRFVRHARPYVRRGHGRTAPHER